MRDARFRFMLGICEDMKTGMVGMVVNKESRVGGVELLKFKAVQF